MASLGRILKWSLLVGLVCFALGFFGPMVLAPGANQGPLLGILITGPLGLVAGLVVGVWRELVRRPGAGRETMERHAWISHPAVRAAVGLGGAGLVIRGVLGLGADEGRGAAAAIVLGGLALYFAAVGRMPSWFGR